MVRSDSQAAIMALESTRTTSKTVRDCKRVLKQAKENHRIAIRWIKGHDDHTGNELADHLARTGSETKTLDCHPTIPVPKSFISRKLKDHFTARWQKVWIAKGPRQSKIFFPEVSGRKTKKLVKWSKQNLNLLIQIGTGHALVAHHISKWTEVEDKCQICEEGEESTPHLFFQCQALERQRREILTTVETKEHQILEMFKLPRLTDLMRDRGRSCTR